MEQTTTQDTDADARTVNEQALATAREEAVQAERESEATRIDAAAGLAILLREKAERVVVATFSNQVAAIPPRRGFALRDAIKASLPHQGTSSGMHCSCSAMMRRRSMVRPGPRDRHY